MALPYPLIVPGIRLDKDADAETKLALERARQPWVAGFILFGGHAEQVAQLTADLRHEAGRPIFIASDMERGAGQQVAGLTRLPDLGILGLAAMPHEARACGEITARDAMSVGIDVVFGPCLDVRSEVDNPILGNRAFGFEPWRVADLGCEYVGGIEAGGALAVAKHFPGHGGTREDSHEALPVVEADLATLEVRDLEPFHKALWWAGCPGLMTSHVSYPALDATGAIASFSAPIVARARALVNPNDDDPGVLVFTDALLMAGATVPGGEPEAARRSLAAGCDMLLYPAEPEAVAASLAVSEAEAVRVHENLQRFLTLGAARAAEVEEADPELARQPDRIAWRALHRAGRGPTCYPDLLVLLDDDAMEDRGAVLAAAAAAHDTPVVHLRVPAGDTFSMPELDLEEPALLSVAIVVFAAARGWKGSSGASEACATLAQQVAGAVWEREGLPSTVWCAPRPGGFGDLHLPGTGPQVERALARRLFPTDDELVDARLEGDPDEA